MDDYTIALRNLEELIKAIEPEEMMVAERAAIFAASGEIRRDLERFIDSEDCGGDGTERCGDPYAHEKAFNVHWHIKAALGYGITNGHDVSHHRVSALGNLSTLGDVLKRIYRR